MALLGGSRSNVKERVKQAKAAARRLEQQKQKELTGGRSAANISATISNIKLTTQKYLSKYVDQYLLLRTESEVIAYFDKIIDAGIAAIDTETTGLDTMRCKIVGLCLYVKGEKPCYIPINHIGHISHKVLPNQVSEEFLKTQLQRCVDVKWIFHNAKFDIRVIRHTIGVSLVPYWDTMIAARLLNENESAALKNLHLKYCDSQDSKALTISTLFDGLMFSLIPIECAYLYAAGDAIKTYDLYEFQLRNFEKPHLSHIHNVFKTIEMPLITVLADMEDKGVYIDMDFAHKLQEKYRKYLEDAEKDCYDCLEQYRSEIDAYRRLTPNCKLSDPIALNSPVQIAILIYDILKIAVAGRDGRKTGEEILRQLDHPFTQKLLKYREMSKLITTYVDKLPNVVDERDGRIHPTFNQYGAACVIGDSVIFTENGYERMDELVNDYEYNEFKPFTKKIVNRHNEYEAANGAISYCLQKVITVQTDYGFEISGTYNHPILVWKDGKEEFVQLSELKVDDIVILPTYIDVIKEYNKASVQVDERFGKFYTKPFAEFLGFCFAVSQFYSTTGFNRNKIKFTTNSPNVVDELNILIRDCFAPRSNTRMKVKEHSHLFNITIKGKEISDVWDILQPSSNEVCKIPKAIYRSSSAVINAFIRGAALGMQIKHSKWISDNIEGSLYFYDKADATMIQMHLMAHGIVSLKTKLLSNCYAIVLQNWDLCRFYEQFDIICNNGAYNLISEYKDTHDKESDIADCKFAIREIRRTRVNPKVKGRYDNIYADVYDIHVPETHSFYCNGFISHNTGRLSSSDPNLQNIPSHNKEIRRMFVPEEGKYFVSGDFSQQEPRTLAHMSGDTHFKDAYAQGRDIYAWCGSMVYHIPYEECLEFRPDGSVNPEGKQRRSNMKSIILGLMYGRGAQAIAEQLKISRKEAQGIIDSFYKTFPKVKEFVQKVEHDAKVNGYVETAYGRKRRLPDMRLPEIQFKIIDATKLSTFDPLDLDGNNEPEIDISRKEYFAKRMHNAYGYEQKQKIKSEAKAEGIEIIDNGGKIADASRQCVNSIIQGSAADITKRAMIDIANDPILNDLGFELELTIHDEVIGECPKENAFKAAKRLSEVMINSCADTISVPMKVDSEITERWYGEVIEENAES